MAKTNNVKMKKENSNDQILESTTTQVSTPKSKLTYYQLIL